MPTLWPTLWLFALLRMLIHWDGGISRGRVLTACRGDGARTQRLKGSALLIRKTYWGLSDGALFQLWYNQTGGNMADSDSNKEVLGLKPDFQPYPDRGITYEGTVITIRNSAGEPIMSYEKTWSGHGGGSILKYVTPEQLERWKGRWSR